MSLSSDILEDASEILGGELRGTRDEFQKLSMMCIGVGCCVALVVEWIRGDGVKRIENYSN
jgi:hypothetical protein